MDRFTQRFVNKLIESTSIWFATPTEFRIKKIRSYINEWGKLLDKEKYLFIYKNKKFLIIFIPGAIQIEPIKKYIFPKYENIKRCVWIKGD